VDAQDGEAAGEVGQVHHDAPVEAARPQQRRVEHVGAVRRCNHDDARVALRRAMVRSGDQRVDRDNWDLEKGGSERSGKEKRERKTTASAGGGEERERGVEG
jgi:hypothetical protein